MDSAQDGKHTLLKADEIDSNGTLVPKPPAESRPPRSPPNNAPLDTIQLQQTDGSGLKKNTGPPPPARPPLRRETSTPAPQQPPPPVPPPAVPDASLPQVQGLASNLPLGVEPAPYAYEYKDYSNMEDELEDLFSYSEEEQARLLKAKTTFEEMWQTRSDGATNWRMASRDVQGRFLEGLKDKLVNEDSNQRASALLCLLYLVLGCWGDIAFTGEQKHAISNPEKQARHAEQLAKSLQLAAIRNNVQTIVGTIGAPSVIEAACTACTDVPLAVFAGPSPVGNDGAKTDICQYASWAAKTILYVIIGTALRDADSGIDRLRLALLKMQPGLLNTFMQWLAVLRWDDTANVPSCKVVLLFWKTILLTFGGHPDVFRIKSKLDDTQVCDADNQPCITASPLDYHVFRQEIISKYPAFEPPQPLFPFDPEHNSILPALEELERLDEESSRDGQVNGASGIGTSIMHHPVHIATPAPSPPPSPAGPGGKGVKKQNYQTNQNFPFLYPPLDASSNEIGGKGSTAIQDLLVGRKWSGSDIPTSILEAASLFAQRMRATRAMKQLWDERIRFMQHEKRTRRRRKLKEVMNSDNDEQLPVSLSEDDKQRLVAVEDFYQTSLPNLQSLVSVLLKVLLQTVTALAIQPPPVAPVNGSPSTAQAQEQDAQAATASRVNATAPPNASGVEKPALPPRPVELSPAEFDRLRTQEIMVKGVSSILLLLLKWFKLSHVLKFEYLSQLLFDSNYLHLTLKLFTHQELERVVSIKRERKEHNFFEWCRITSQQSQTKTNVSPDSLPDARSEQSEETTTDKPSQPSTALPTNPPPPAPPLPPPPAVDELGVPTTYIPTTPITTFSTTAFTTIISTLRTVQKLIKSKPHRQLTMVQLKYSNILRKALKVPQPDVRLYALKVIKGQVPYCHRKWRQGNMRVITAIYLHCRPSLRDEWLAGCDVDQEVGEALPQERALRALTYWYNVRRYPAAMAMPPLRELRQNTEPDTEVESAREKTKDAATIPTEDVGSKPEDTNDNEPENKTGDVNEDANNDIDINDDEELDLDYLDLDSDDEEFFNQENDRRGSELGSQLEDEPDFFLQELEKMSLSEAAYSVFSGDEEEREGQAAEQSMESGAVEGW